MFRIILVIVTSLLKASTCVPSAPVNVNDQGGPRCYSCASVEDPYLCNVTTQCEHDEVGTSVEEPYLCNVTTQCGPDEIVASVEEPYLCNVTTLCGHAEQCYTDEYSTNHGASIFSVGCRRIADCHVPIVGRSVSSRRDIKTLKCEECCRGNLCNGGGCSAGIGKGNLCYSCNLLQDPRQCKHEKRCQANEHCSIEKVYTQHYEVKYNLGCVENAECQRLRQFRQPVGKRDKVISTMCASCCYGDRCNDECLLNGSLVTTIPLATTDTIVVDTTLGTLYTSTFINIDTTPVYTTRFASSSSPSTTTDTAIASSYAIPLMNTDRTFVHKASWASSSSPSTITDTTIVSLPTGSLMNIDTTPVDTSRRTPSIGPSMGTGGPVLYTASGTPTINPSVGTKTSVLYTASRTPYISTAAPVFYTTRATPPTSSMNTDTATTNGVQSSLLATSTVHVLSTMRHGVTASPSTSTTPSMTTHGTTSGKDLSTICHADCDGVSGCILPKIQTCSGTTPYCFTQVDNADSGAFNIKKKCADRTTCNTMWWQQTSDDNRCVDYKQGIMDTFSCFYCCTADKCNLNNIKPSSLFKGDD